MPNGAQIHLAVNHLSVVGILIGMLVVFGGFLFRQLSVRRAGLAIYLFSALTLPMAYFSGEPAESIVEHKAGVTELLIHNHEESAEFSLIFMGLLFVATLVALGLRKIKKEKYEDQVTGVATMIAFMVLTILLRTAHLGGMIRHDELRNELGALSVETKKGQ